MLQRVALLAMVGSCLMTPRLLGGPARPCNSSSECLSAQECYFPPVQACGGVREGYCVAELPPCDAGSGLVCGCDGDTYVSVCDAEGITDLAHFGACQIGDSCGGQTCTGNNFCQTIQIQTRRLKSIFSLHLLVSSSQHAFDKIAISQNALITLVKNFGFSKHLYVQPTAGTAQQAATGQRQFACHHHR